LFHIMLLHWIMYMLLGLVFDDSLAGG